MIWTADFWRGAGERAIKTFAQVLAAVIMVNAGGDTVPAVGFDGINWLTALSFAGLSAVLSIVTSIGNADFTAGSTVVDDSTKAEG